MSQNGSHDVGRVLPAVDWALPQDDPVGEVERQMERGSQFTQAALDKLVARLAGAEEYITELVGILRARGVLSDADLVDEEAAENGPSQELVTFADTNEPSVGTVTSGNRPEPAPVTSAAVSEAEEANEHRRGDAEVDGSGTVTSAEAATTGTVSSSEAAAMGCRREARSEAVATEDMRDVQVPGDHEHSDAELNESGTQARVSWPGIAFRVDPEDPAPPVAVNCAERMHVCDAVCCKLNFALTPEEVDEGKVKWDLGFPYMIRHGSNGYCAHNDTSTGRCTNYVNRPGVCHRYSCAHDPRIWKDFDGMVLNEEWIRTNLANQSRIVVGRALPLMEVKHGTEAS